MANHAAGLPKLGPVAESAAGDAPAGPLLSPSHDFLGIGPVGWSGAAIVLVVIALATTPFGVREAPPETKPLLVGLTLETRPAPPAPEPPTPSADLPAAPPEPLASPMPSAEPSPEAATPADEEPYTLPAPSEVATAPPPTAAAPPEALQRPPPPKPRAPPAPRHRAPTTATKVPPAAPTQEQEAALPIVPPRPISGMPDNAVADHAAQADPHHVEGEVILRVEVSATGNLISVAIAQSSGNDVLDQAALLVVRHWRFSPATRGGEPVAGTAEVPIWSRLED
jgi:protein TonB